MNVAARVVLGSAMLGTIAVGQPFRDGVGSERRETQTCPAGPPDPAIVPPSLFVPIPTSAVVDGSPEEEATLAFIAARRAIVDSRSAADPMHPDLLASMTGDTLSAMQTIIEDARASCRGVRTSVVIVLGDVAVVGPTATVEFCAIEDSEWFDLATGEQSGEFGAVFQYGVGHLEIEKDRWKLAANDPVHDNCDAMGIDSGPA